MSQDSISNKLSELFDLFQSGAITKEEFETLKSELLKTGDSSNTGSKASLNLNDLQKIATKEVFDDRLKVDPLKLKKERKVIILVAIIFFILSLVICYVFKPTNLNF